MGRTVNGHEYECKDDLEETDLASALRQISEGEHRQIQLSGLDRFVVHQSWHAAEALREALWDRGYVILPREPQP